jgi:hypothetical protein
MTTAGKVGHDPVFMDSGLALRAPRNDNPSDASWPGEDPAIHVFDAALLEPVIPEAAHASRMFPTCAISITDLG